MKGKPYGHSEDLTSLLDVTVYPALWDRLDSAFPEFGWSRKGRLWEATNKDDTRTLQGSPRPDRVEAYENTPWGFIIQGGDFVRWLSYVSGNSSPRGQSFIDAVRTLCDKAGVLFPERTRTPEQADAAEKNEARRSVLETVVEAAEKAIRKPENSKAADYLTGRGFTVSDIRDLRFGFYERAAVLKSLTEAGCSDDAAEAGVLVPYLDRSVIVPWNDEYGRLLNLYSVPLASPKEKKSLPGEGRKRSPLYLDRAQAAHQKDLVLVEGVFDAALLQVKGDSRVIATGGGQLTGEQLETLVRYRTRSVYICGDPDEAGDRGTLANVAALEKAGIKAYVVPRLPDGKDPDEFVNANGIDAWKTLVLSSEHSYTFRARDIVGRHKASGEAVWTDRAVDEALDFDVKTTDKRGRMDLEKHFWPVLKKSLELEESSFRACLEARRREADRTQEEKTIAEQVLAYESLLESLRVNKTEMGPRLAVRQLNDEIDALRRGGLRLKVDAVRSVAEELAEHEEHLQMWRGREYIGLPQRTLPALDDATLGLRGLMLLAAAPNVGKTALAVQLGTDIVVHNKDACFVFLSLEMPRAEILTRIKCRLAGMDWKTLVFGDKRNSGEVLFAAEQLGNLKEADQKLRDFGDRIVILDEKNFPRTEATVEKLVHQVQAIKARTGTTRAFVLVDYLQVLPIPEAEKRNIRTDLDADKFRIGAMKTLLDYLDGDAVMVISEARKPSGDEDWAGNIAAVMGAARGSYTPDMILLFGPHSDKDLMAMGKDREELQTSGITLNKLTIAKGRDGVTKKEISLTFSFRQSAFTEGVDSNNGNNFCQPAKVNKRKQVTR